MKETKIKIRWSNNNETYASEGDDWFLIGKKSFSTDKLLENAKSAIDAVSLSRPDGFKGKFVKSAHISSTMNPSLRLSSSIFN